MGRWILSLILAGAGSAAAAEEARRTLGVTATVTQSCTFGRLSSGPMACTRGTSWTSAKSAEPLAAPAAPLAVHPGATYLTITY